MLHFTLSVIAMSAMSYMMSTDKSQKRHKNSAMLLTTLKLQQQKSEKQQIFMKTVNAEWHTIINRLNKLTDDLLKLKEADQQKNKVLEIIWWVKTLWIQTNWSKNSVQRQFLKIEKKLNNLIESDIIQWIRLSWICKKSEVQ